MGSLDTIGEDMTYSEVTPNYSRISGTDIAGDPKAAIQAIVEKFRDIDISAFMLKEFDSFEQTFVAMMVLKFHMMVAKQNDYGPGNISKAGLRGVMTRATDKLERIKSLIGEPESQVETIKLLLERLPDDADVADLDEFAWNVNKTINPSNAVGDERVDDTLMDLGNYGDIAYVLYHGAWGKQLEKNI